MVYQKAVGLMLRFAVLAQRGGHRLALFARVGENEAFMTAGVFEDVAQTGVGGRWGCVGGGLGSCGRRGGRCGRRGTVGQQLVGLWTVVEEVLHGDAPACAGALYAGYHGAPTGVGAEKTAHHLRVADGGAEAYAPRLDTGHAAETLYQAEGLPAAVAAKKGVYLVDYHKAQVAEEMGYLAVALQQHGLKALWRNLQDAGGALHEFLLVRLRHVAMPVPHGYAALGADVVETHKLVVDEGFQRGDVQAADGAGRVFLHQRDDGEEGGLGLAGSRGGGEQHMTVGMENGVGGGGLDGAQLRPAALVHILLDGGGESVEDVLAHGVRW